MESGRHDPCARCYGFALVAQREAQLPADPVERAKVIAQIFQANASQLTIFDRKGNALGQVGSRDLHQRPTLSPDGKRIAVIKPDIDKETSDAWIVDATSGESIRLTTSQSREGAQGVVWSPDGSQVAYVALRGGYFGLYRQPSSGGAEELLYQNSAPMTVTEWSLDGRYLGYFSTDLSGGRLYALPLATSGRAQADRGLPQRASSAGHAFFSRQPLRLLRIERIRSQ